MALSRETGHSLNMAGHKLPVIFPRRRMPQSTVANIEAHAAKLRASANETYFATGTTVYGRTGVSR